MSVYLDKHRVQKCYYCGRFVGFDQWVWRDGIACPHCTQGPPLLSGACRRPLADEPGGDNMAARAYYGEL